ISVETARSTLSLGLPNDARVLNLGASYLHLSESDRAALIAATEQSLRPSPTTLSLSAGDHYVSYSVTDNQGNQIYVASTATATGPLVATRHFKLWTYPGAIPITGVPDVELSGPCWPFCEPSPKVMDSISANGDLLLRSSTEDAWTYSRPNGQVVLADAPNSVVFELALMEVAAAVTWSSGWRVDARVNGGGSLELSGGGLGCQVAMGTFSVEFAGGGNVMPD